MAFAVAASAGSNDATYTISKPSLIKVDAQTADHVALSWHPSTVNVTAGTTYPARAGGMTGLYGNMGPVSFNFTWPPGGLLPTSALYDVLQTLTTKGKHTLTVTTGNSAKSVNYEVT